MHDSVLEFFFRHLAPEEVADKRVLEVGALDVNGSVRPYIESLGPASYLATDMRPGRGVDRVLNAERLVEELGERSFELVVSTEMLEHAVDWRACLVSMMRVLSDGGLLLLSARSPGFPPHGFPEDHWRFSLADMAVVLARNGWPALAVESDPLAPGVFIKTRRPLGWEIYIYDGRQVARPLPD